MIRRALLIGLALGAAWLLWAVAPDLARSRKARQREPRGTGAL
jgi:hypothetical protein